MEGGAQAFEHQLLLKFIIFRKYSLFSSDKLCAASQIHRNLDDRWAGANYLQLLFPEILFCLPGSSKGV